LKEAVFIATFENRHITAFKRWISSLMLLAGIGIRCLPRMLPY